MQTHVPFLCRGLACSATVGERVFHFFRPDQPRGTGTAERQCSIDNLSFTPNANHDGIVVHGIATGCNLVTVRFTNP